MHKSIFKNFYLISFVLIVGSILLFFNTGEIYAYGTPAGTTIRQNFGINSATSLKVDGNTDDSDTIVKPVYGVVWTDTFISSPVQGNNLIDTSYLPGDTAWLTYKFINRSNDFDTFYISLGEFYYSQPIDTDWVPSIWKNQIKLGDSTAVIPDVASDSIVTFKVALHIPLFTPEITGGCTVSIKTESIPSGIYQGDNNDTYAGHREITDFDNGETTFINIINSKINITYPITSNNYYDTKSRTITIAGSTENSNSGDTIEIFTICALNSDTLNTTVVLTSDSGSFEGTALLTGIGDKILVKLHDQIFGNLAYDTINVNYFDTLVLQLEMDSGLSVADSEPAFTRDFDISGTAYFVQQGDTIIVINDRVEQNPPINISTISETYFTIVAMLDDRLNTVVIEVHDQFGRVFADTRIVFLQPYPYVNIHYPVDEHDTKSNLITIGGTTYNTVPGDTVKIFVNDIFQGETNVTEIDGSWSGTALLTGIGDTVWVEVQDRFGEYHRYEYDTITVNFLDTMSIQISSPVLTSYDTYVQEIQISGTSKNTKSGDTVYIYLNDTLPASVHSYYIIQDYNDVWNGTVQLSGIADTVYVVVEQSFASGDTRTASHYIIINYFDSPVIAITNVDEENFHSLTTGKNYNNPYETNLDTVSLSGTTKWTKPGDSVLVYVQGILLSDTDSGDTLFVIDGHDSGWFIPEIALNDYLNTVVIEIFDNWERTSVDTIYIYSYPQPEIEIFAPVSGSDSMNYYDTNFKNITIQGTVRNIRNNDTITLLINNEIPTDAGKDTIIIITGLSDLQSDTTFSFNIKLNDFLNTVSVQVNDMFERTADTYEFIYFYPQSTVSITNPTENHDTSVSPIYLTVETDSSHQGDTLSIYLISGSSNGDLSSAILQSDTILPEHSPHQFIWTSGTTSLSGFGDTVFVVLTNRFGDTVYAHVVINYLDDLDIKIISPVPTPYDTKVQEIHISGTSKNTKSGDTVYLFVNDTSPESFHSYFVLDGYDSAWFGTVSLSGISDTVYVFVEQSFATGDTRTASHYIIVNYFDTPVIAITKVGEEDFNSLSAGKNYNTPYETNLDTVSLSGTTKWTKPGDSVLVYINGDLISDTDSGDTLFVIDGHDSGWVIPKIALNDYLNTVVIKILDNWERTSVDTIYIYSYPQPEIDIFAPVSGSDSTNYYDTNIKIITIQGTVRNIRNNDTITLLINNDTPTDAVTDTIIIITGLSDLQSDTTFSFSIKLNDFLNTVSVQVNDMFERTADTYEFIYFYPQSTVSITNPTQNHDTSVSPIYLTVETDSSHQGDTLSIYLISGSSNGDFSSAILQSDTVLPAHPSRQFTWTSGTTSLSGFGDTVFVVLTNRFGDTVYAHVVINYLDDLDIKITSPVPSSYDTKIQEIDISGTSKNTKSGDTVYLFVNDTSPESFHSYFVLTDYDSAWTGTVQLSGIADTVYVVVEQSFASKDTRTASHYIIVNYFDSPVIAITKVGEEDFNSLSAGKNYNTPYETNLNTVSLSGTTKWTKPGDSVLVYVNGDLISDTNTSDTLFVIDGYDSGWFISEIALNDYLNTVVIEILDNWERTSVDTIYIYSYPPPEIEIFAPVSSSDSTNYYDTNIKNISIQGTVRNIRNNDTITLLINNDTPTDAVTDTIIIITGLPDLQSDTTFFFNIKLNDFLNTVSVQVNDMFERTADTYEFIYYYPPSTVSITNPTQNHDTSVSPIYLTVETDSSHQGDTLSIYLVSGSSNDSLNTDTLQSDTVLPAHLSRQFTWIGGTTSLSGFGDTVFVVLTNRFGDTVFAHVVINYLDDLDIKIILPVPTFYDTKVQEIYISGTSKNTKSGDTVYIYLNDTLPASVHSYFVLTDYDSAWTGTVQLSGIDDTVYVVVEQSFASKDTRTASHYIIVNYFDSPVISITNVNEEDFNSLTTGKNYNTPYETNLDTVSLSGTTKWTKPGDSVLVYVNNFLISDTDTSDTLFIIDGHDSGWVIPEIALNDYLNTVVIEIFDNWGRTSVDTIYIYSYPQPEIEIFAPVSGSDSVNYYDTNIKIITIQGTVRNIRNNDTITLLINNDTPTDVETDTIIIITGLSDLQSDTTFSFNIKLNDFLNTVSVQVNDRFDRTADTYEFIYFYPQSTVSITNPQPYHDTSSQVIFIFGQTDTSHIGDTVYLYVKSATTGSDSVFQSDTVLVEDNGIWQGTVSLTGIGDTVIAILENRFGDTVYDTRIFNYFSDLSVKITAPDTIYYDTKIQIIHISGTSKNTKSGDTVYMFVNDNNDYDSYFVIIEHNGDWSGTVALTGTGDSVWVRVEQDFSGASTRTKYDTITVNFFKVPLVSITQPATETAYENPYDTNVQSVALSGTSEWTKSDDTVAVYINDVLQIETTAIDSMHGVWTLPAITLNDNLNTIVVQVNDNWGRQNTDTIYIYYYPEPSVAITSPVDFYDTAEQIIVITGSSENTNSGDTLYIYLYGRPDPDTFFVLDDYNGDWSGTVSLTGLGDSVWVKLTDQFERNAYDTVTVNYFDTLIVEINIPITGTDTTVPFYTISDTIIISGTVAQIQDGDTIIVELNGTLQPDSIVTVSTMGDTEWFLEIALQDRMNTAVIIAHDQFGRTSYDTRYIFLQSEPVIKITLPEDMHDTKHQTIIITGTTYNTVAGDTVEIFVNSDSQGETYITQLDGNWQYEITLTEKILELGLGDSVWVKITDRFDRTEYDTITINYFDTPVITITSPDTETTYGSPYDTNIQNIILSGTSDWTKSGDTVTLFINSILLSETTIIETINGNWTLPEISLNDFLNTVVVQINDNWGRQHTDTIYIYYFPVPEITITNPQTYHDTSSQVIFISGQTDTSHIGDTVYLYVKSATIGSNSIFQSDTVLVAHNGNWQGTVSLTGLGDSVWVKLTDQFNRNAYDTVTVNYFDYPIIAITKVEEEEFNSSSAGKDYNNPYETNLDTVFLSGTTKWTKPGDSVLVYVNDILLSDNNIGDTLFVIDGHDSGWIIPEIALNDFLNTVVIEVVDNWQRTSVDTIFIFYYPPIDIKITSPETEHDTFFETILVSGTALNSLVGDTVWIYVNDNLNDTVNLTFDNSSSILIWSSTIDLVPNELNFITAKLFDRFGNYSYDTITVNSMIDPPLVDVLEYEVSQMFDTTLSITLKWLISDTTFIDTGITFNIYKIIQSDSVKVNTDTIYYQSGIYNGTFNYSIHYNTEYTFIVTSVNRFNMEKEGDSITVFFRDISNIKVMGFNHNDTTLVSVILLDSQGNTISYYDNNTASITITELIRLSGNFSVNNALIIDGKADFVYNKSENGVLRARFNVVGRTFEVLMFLRKYPANIPVVFIGNVHNYSRGIISIEFDNYINHYEDEYNLIISNFDEQSDTSMIERANQHIYDNTPFKPAAIITNNKVNNAHQFLVKDRHGDTISDLPAPIDIIIDYYDENNDGILDFTDDFDQPVSISSMRMFKLNQSAEVWQLVPDYNSDLDINIISTNVENLSVYSVVGSVMQINISDMIVYPNPYKPGIDPLHTVVTFDNVVPGTRVRIFNVVGQLISDRTVQSNNYILTWDGTNDHGQKVAPGVYIYLVEYENEKHVGKIIIVR